MPLQNRADPFGQLHAVAARGTMMGNRGGRIHNLDQTLSSRRYASRRWICCLCEFKERQRRVWGDSYTELFFLDEVTALAGGHRPCFECRRAEAIEFARLFAGDAAERRGTRASADDMDKILHAERQAHWRGDRPCVSPLDLPDGAMIEIAGEAVAIRDGHGLRWGFSGYRLLCPVADIAPNSVPLLTPPSIIQVLAAGFRPVWHSSAGAT